MGELRKAPLSALSHPEATESSPQDTSNSSGHVPASPPKAALGGLALIHSLWQGMES